jgi:hypothetical protein
VSCTVLGKVAHEAHPACGGLECKSSMGYFGLGQPRCELGPGFTPRLSEVVPRLM